MNMKTSNTKMQGVSLLIGTLCSLLPLHSLAGVAGDYDAVPPVISLMGANDKPNIMVILDNSNSMDEATDGHAVGSASSDSKSEIARTAIKSIINTFGDSMRMGLMAYEQSSIRLRQLHDSQYDASFDPSNYNASYTGDRDSLTKAKRTPNPTDPSNFIYYNIALPFYSGSSLGNAFCYSSTADFDNGSETAGGGPWDRYDCYRSKTGTSDSGTTGMSSYWFRSTFSPTDSDYAQNILDFGRFLTWQHVGDTWYSNSSPGGGQVHVDIDDVDTAHKADLDAKLATSQFSSATDTPLRNAGLTPIAGALEDAGTYFGTYSSGNYCSAAENDYVILVTDGLPSVDKTGTTTTDTAAAITAAADEAAALLADGIRTYVIGFALPTGVDPTLLDEIATAGGTTSSYDASDQVALNAALNSIFLNIINRASSGTGAAVLANNSRGDGAFYQALYIPKRTDSLGNEVTWVGVLNGLFIDQYGHLREDTNGNGAIDGYSTDRVVEYFYDTVEARTRIYLKSGADQNNLSTVATVEIDDLNYIWSARDQLEAISDPITQRTYTDSAANGRAIYTTNDGQNLTDLIALTAAEQQALVDAETAAEAARDAAEAAADASEILRNDAYADYTAAEVTKLADEATAAAAEADKLADEATAATAEAAKLADEATATAAETTKLADETALATAEAEKLADEAAVNTADATRIADQAARDTAFSDYEDAEDDLTDALVVLNVRIDNYSDMAHPDYNDFDLLLHYYNTDYLPVLDARDTALTTYNTAEANLTASTTAYNNAVADLTASTAAYNTAVTNLTASTAAYNTAQTNLAASTATYDAAAADLATSTAAYNTAATNLAASTAAYESAKTAYESADAQWLSDVAAYNASVVAYNDAVDQALEAQYFSYMDLTAADANTTIRWIRGEEQSGYRSRMLDWDSDGVAEVWRLGDIIHSTPVVVATPKERYDLTHGDPTYAAFVDKYYHRRHVIYVGGNDGMLHAFNAGFWDDSNKSYETDDSFASGTSSVTAHPLGSELWAYVPKAAMPHLQWLTSTTYSHSYYVDGEPITFDANIFTADDDHPNGWGTLLVVPMRLGGGVYTFDTDGDGTDEEFRSSISIFDVTNPENPPVLLAEITDDELGFTTSTPAVVKARIEATTGGFGTPAHDRWLLAFGNGPDVLDTATSTQNAKLFLYDLESLSFVSGYDPLDLGDSNSYLGSIGVADWETDYVDDALYFGINQGYDTTETGKIGRVRLGSSDTSNFAESTWLSYGTSSPGLGTLYNSTRTTVGAPLAVRDDNGRHWIYSGTGRLFTSHDNSSDDQHYFYGIMEPINSDADETLATVTTSELEDTTDIRVFLGGEVDRNGSSFQIPSGTDIDNFNKLEFAISNSKQGWYNKLDYPGAATPSGRNINGSARFRSLIFYTEYTPSSAQCQPEGTSKLHAIHYKTGTATPYDVIGTDSNVQKNGEDLVVEEEDLGLGLASAPTIITNNAGTNDNSAGTLAIQLGTGELKLINFGEGGTRSGRESWQEINMDGLNL